MSISTAELDGFMAEVPSEVIVVLDEAYFEFATDAEVVDGMAAYRKFPNLVLARTFSKAHGLAGLRVGFGVADPTIATALRQVIAPFSVTSTAQVAAVESLSRNDEVLVRAKDVAALSVRSGAGRSGPAPRAPMPAAGRSARHGRPGRGPWSAA